MSLVVDKVKKKVGAKTVSISGLDTLFKKAQKGDRISMNNGSTNIVLTVEEIILLN